jgi:DNA-directed RNA polymerase subunit RPC12/RpoP
MAIKVRLRCSECTTIRDVEIDAEERDISCPVCGRRIQNLTADEHSEITAVQKNQQLCGIISLVLLALTAVCFVMWAGDTSTWPTTKNTEPNVALFAGAMICALGSLVLGILGSRKRFVVEF